MAIAEEFPLTLVHVLSNRITRHYVAEAEKSYGLTLAEWRVLLSVAQEPGLSAAEITAYWAMEKMAVNRAIRRMLDGKLIVRSRNPDDGRAYCLHLTDEGRVLYDRLHDPVRARSDAMIAALSQQEQGEWVEFMSRLITNVDTLR